MNFDQLPPGLLHCPVERERVRVRDANVTHLETVK